MQSALSRHLFATVTTQLRAGVLGPALCQVVLSQAVASSAPESTAATPETAQALQHADGQNAQRAHFRTELSRLRKLWAEDTVTRKRQREAFQAAQRETAIANRRSKQQQQQLRKKEQAAERAQEEQFGRILRAAKAKQGQVWREATAAIYEQELEGRVLSLMAESSHWIRAEDLDARISEALDNPVDLFSDEEDLYLADSEEEELEEGAPAQLEQPVGRPRPLNRLRTDQQTESVW